MKKGFNTKPKQFKSFPDNYRALITTAAFLLLSFGAMAQYDSTKVLQQIQAYGFDWKNGAFRYSFRIPTGDTLTLAVADSGSLRYYNGGQYYWNGYYWLSSGTGGSGSTVVSDSAWMHGGNVGLDTSNYIGNTDSVPSFEVRNEGYSILYVTRPHTWLTQAPQTPTAFGFPANALTSLGFRANEGLRDKLKSGTISSSGYGNTAIGNYALTNVGRFIDSDSSTHVTASGATAVGSFSGINLQFGNTTDYGRFTGVGSLNNYMTISAQGVTSVGGNAMERANKVTNNTAVGTSALRTIVNGSYNTMIGTAAGYSLTGQIGYATVTAPGSGYTTATATITPPRTYAQPNMPYINEIQATATVQLSGGQVVGITITNPGGGYSAVNSENWTHGTNNAPTITISGDGTGATATVTVTNADHNTFIGQASNWMYRGGWGNSAIGSATGNGVTRYRDTTTNLFGAYSQVASGVAEGLKNATAIGAYTQIAQSNTVVLGDSAQTTLVAVGTKYADSTLSVVGSLKVTKPSIINSIKITRGLAQSNGLVIGAGAGSASYTPIQNHLIGYLAGAGLTPGSGLSNADQNTAFGYAAMYQATGAAQSVAIGHNSLRTQQSGVWNTAIGYESMRYGNGTGIYNTAVGANSLKNNSSGSSNVAVGTGALGTNTTGSDNIAVGRIAGGANLTGSDNIMIGDSAGHNITVGAYNIIIGSADTAAISTGSRQLNIGGWIKGDSGRIAIGGPYTTSSALLDLQSTTNGLLIPRMNTTQQNAIVSPANGLAIYNTDTSDYMVYKSSSWQRIGGAGGGGGSGTVNSGTQYRLGYYATAGTAISEAAVITANRALISDANGVPTHSAVTATQLGYVDATSSIQTQIDGKANTALSNLASVAINTSLLLGTSDAAALGSTTKQWSDLFLAEGGVINWDNGDATITQVGNNVTLDGAAFTVTSPEQTPASFTSSFAGNMQVNWNSSTSNNVNFVFQKGGTTQWYIGNNASINKFHILNASAGEAVSVLQGLQVGINKTAPTARLHVGASATTANYGSIKIDEGSRQTVAEDGTINYVANNLEFTEGSTVHILAKTLTATATLDFGSTSPSTSTDLTITVTGAADGDAVSIGVPNGSVNANSNFTAWVSATNTVTIRFNNYQTVGSIDPASGTFRASVIKY